MEIPRGNYVRTKKGIIYQADQDFNLNNDIPLRFATFSDRVVKHSKDITEILEDKDIIKIEISEEWVEQEEKEATVVIGEDWTILELKEALEDGLCVIKSIVTHQSFKQVEYEV